MASGKILCLIALLSFNFLCDAAADRWEREKDFIQDMIDGVRPLLTTINIEHLDFDTGKQEFGRFNGSIAKTTITGMDKFVVSNLDYSLFPPEVRNITVDLSHFDVVGKYKINGMLKFPLGNEPLRVFGDGDMKLRIGNVTNSMSLSFKVVGEETKVNDLQITVDVRSMKMKLGDFMGGGVMEDVFNEYFSVIGPVIFDHYKAGIIEEMKKPVIEEIEKFLAGLDKRLKE